VLQSMPKELFRSSLPVVSFGSSHFRTAVLVLSAILVVSAPRLSWATDTPGAQDGAAAFKTKCVACHGPDGAGTAVGKSLKAPDLRSEAVQKQSDADLATFIANGKGNMPSFKSSTSDEQIRALVMHVRSLAPKKKAEN